MNDNKKKIERDLEYIEEDIEHVEDETETAIEVNNVEDGLNYEARVSNVENRNIAEYEATYTNEINEAEEIIEQLEEPDRPVIQTIPMPMPTEMQTEVVSPPLEPYPVELSEEKPTEKRTFINSVKVKEDGHYIDYKLRLAAHIGVFVTLFVLTIILLQNAFNLSSSTMINYNENSNLDYKVYLKPNDFYEEEYLGKDKVYVASLIDRVLIDFIYNFNIEKASDVKFGYDVVAKLTINDSSSGNNYFEKEYVLLNTKNASIENSTNYSLFEQIEIDYAYYNNLANNFKQQYGVETTSNLTVYLRVNKQNDVDNAVNSVANSTMFVKIPLSQKSVDIELNYQDINNSSYIIKTNESMADNIAFGIAAAVAFIIAIVVAIKLIRLLGMLRTKKSIYDKYVDRILNEYDRLIVENKTGPDLVKNNVIKISKFEELLDVRDNIKLPIMYYVIAKHTKCCFYIKHNRDLYLLTIKAVDLEEANNEKK